ncbi:small GTPase LIP1 isoform X1 [Iris pallida]|uniref:Small GTPase LIP1 isoform X1 n=1 Tax=Iris pallida TaxID=29817 RepID=A0AAX6EFN2_IRIPA|nr:small GTPase LIP1 isoform X1 [Iris pallida]
MDNTEVQWDILHSAVLHDVNVDPWDYILLALALMALFSLIHFFASQLVSVLLLLRHMVLGN